jgi:hypothetical protein
LASIYPFLIVPLGLANLLSNTLMGGLGWPDRSADLLSESLRRQLRLFTKNQHLSDSLAHVFFPAVLSRYGSPACFHVLIRILAVSIGIGQLIPAFWGFFL